MAEIIVKMDKRIKLKGGKYVRDIVRCKECEHWTNGDDTYGICYRCPNTRQMRCDDFCSYGERKE